jgi:hypothetical protein
MLAVVPVPVLVRQRTGMNCPAADSSRQVLESHMLSNS